MDWEPHDRHWIRLRGPWEVVRVDPDGQETKPERIKLPTGWTRFCQENAGTARFTRRFQRPTNLEPDERVVVTLTNVNREVIASINNHQVAALTVPLGDPGCWPAESCRSFDVTPFLQESNTLNLQLDLPSSEQSARSGLHEPVLLEIICLDDLPE